MQRILKECLRSAKQKPRQNSNVFELAVSQNTKIFAMFSPTQSPKHPYLRGLLKFFTVACRCQGEATYKNALKSAQQKRQKPTSTEPLRKKNRFPGFPARHIKIDDQKWKRPCLPVRGRRMHENIHYRTVKNNVFQSPTSRPIKNVGF